MLEITLSKFQLVTKLRWLLETIAPIVAASFFVVRSGGAQRRRLSNHKKDTADSGIKLLKKKLFQRFHRNGISTTSHQMNWQFCFAVDRLFVNVITLWIGDVIGIFAIFVNGGFVFFAFV